MSEMTLFQNRQGRAVGRAMTEGLSSVMPPRVSIRGNQFTLLDAAGERYAPPNPTSLDVVIVDANQIRSQIFYTEKWSDGMDNPPTCFSDNGVAPSKAAMYPQSRTCIECPNYEIGSAIGLGGRKVRACREYRKLAVIVVGDPTQIPYLLAIPPASLTNMKNYSQRIGSHKAPGTDRPLDVSDLITRITFRQGVNGILEFNEISYIDEELAQQVDHLWAEKGPALDHIVGRDDVPWEGPAPTGQVARQQPQPQLHQPPRSQPAPAPAPAPAQPQRFQLGTPVGRDTGTTEAKPSARGGARPGAGRPPGRPPKPQTVAPAPSRELQEKQQSMGGVGIPDRHPSVAQNDRPLDSGIPQELQRRPQPNFGVVEGKKPSAELDTAIVEAFKLQP